MDLGAGESYTNSVTTATSGNGISQTASSSSVYQTLFLIQSDDPTLKVEAAREIRRLTKTSKRYRRYFCNAVKPLVDMLRSNSFESKESALIALLNLAVKDERSSKTAEKCTALIESLVCYEEGRTALTSEEGGILAVVEVLESGSLQSREHAVGALLTMCQSDRCKYREPILKEGIIPGLLELTVQGTSKSQTKAQTLLRLLRDTPCPNSELEPDTLENIVSNVISQIDEEEHLGKTKEMLAEMVQVSMEQSLRYLQQRALICTPADLSISSFKES